MGLLYLYLFTDLMIMSSGLTAKEGRNNRKCSGKGMAGGWSNPCPDRFTPEKRNPVPIAQEAVWATLPI